MKISRHVCTLEQSKRFDELGVNTAAMFYWHFGSGMKWELLPKGYFDEEGEGVEYFPAYTVSEISRVLKGRMPFWVHIWGEWGYKEEGGQNRGYDCFAHASAERLLYLLDHEHISVSDTNILLHS